MLFSPRTIRLNLIHIYHPSLMELKRYMAIVPSEVTKPVRFALLLLSCCGIKFSVLKCKQLQVLRAYVS